MTCIYQRWVCVDSVHDWTVIESNLHEKCFLLHGIFLRHIIGIYFFFFFVRFNNILQHIHFVELTFLCLKITPQLLKISLYEFFAIIRLYRDRHAISTSIKLWNENLTSCVSSVNILLRLNHQWENSKL